MTADGHWLPLMIEAGDTLETYLELMTTDRPDDC